MKDVPFSTVEIEQSRPSLERDFSSRYLGTQATHEVVEDPTNTSEINQHYSDPEFPMLSRVIINGEEYMVTGTWFSVDDNYNYSTDMLAVQRMTPDGKTLQLTPSELREKIDKSVADKPVRFEISHGANSTALDILQEDKKFLSVEIDTGYTQEELTQFIVATESALLAIDKFVDGKSHILLDGLRIKIGEDISSGGGEAISADNLILLNGRKSYISLAKLRQITGSYDDNELQGGSLDQNDTSSAFIYNFVHEVGHIIDERTISGSPRHRVPAAESPTRYGRIPDQHNSEKDHEAFAEGFAHMVFDMPVSDTLAKAVHETIQTKLAE